LNTKPNYLSLFQKNILIMFRGSFISQIIGLIGYIFIAKIYGADAYGVFGTFISIAAILTILYTLQLENVIVTSKNEGESKNIMSAVFVITTAMAMLSLGICFIFSKTPYANNIDFKVGILEVGILIVIFGLISAFNRIQESFFTYKKKFKELSLAKILFTFTTLSFQFILYYNFKILGLVYGSIISAIGIAIFYYTKNKQRIKTPSVFQIKKTLKDHASILKFLLPSSLVNSFANNLTTILMVSFFSLKDSGTFFLSLKILAAPLLLISNSVSQIYFEKAAKLYRESVKKLYRLTKQIVLLNGAIIIVILILLNTLGIYLLELYLDKDWENLRTFIKILSFLIFLRTCFNPISNIMIVLDKNHIALIFNIYLLLTNITAILVGHHNNNIHTTLVIISIFGGLGYLALLIYFLSVLKNEKNEKT